MTSPNLCDEVVAVDTAAEMRHYMQTGEKVPAEVIGRWRALINKCEALSAAKPPASGGVEAVREALLGYLLKPGQYETASAFARGQNRVAVDMLGVLDEASLSPAATPVSEATGKPPLQVGSIPRAENTGRYLAETNDGRLLYLNHANEWQEMPNILAKPASSPAGGEERLERDNAELREADRIHLSATRGMESRLTARALSAEAALAAERERGARLLIAEYEAQTLCLLPILGESLKWRRRVTEDLKELISYVAQIAVPGAAMEE